MAQSTTTATSNVVLSPSNYLDQVMAIQGLNALQGIFNMKDGITMETVGKLIAYLTIDGVKSVVQIGIQWLKDNFKASMIYNNGFYGWLTSVLNSIIKYLKSFNPVRLFKKQERIPNENRVCYTVEIKTELTKVFWECLYDSYIKDKTNRYTRILVESSYKQESKTRMWLTETWEHMVIDLGDCTCEFKDPIRLKFDYNTETGEKFFAKSKTLDRATGIKLDHLKVTSLLDYIPYPKFVEALKKKIEGLWHSSIANFSVDKSKYGSHDRRTLAFYKNQSASAYATGSHLSTYGILDYFPNVTYLAMEYLFIYTLCNRYINSKNEEVVITTISNFFGLRASCMLFQNLSMESYLDKFQCNELEHADLAKKWLCKMFTDTSTVDDNDQEVSAGILTIVSRTLKSDQLNNRWNDYLKELSNTSIVESSGNKKVKTFMIKIKKTEHKKEVDNEAFLEWQKEQDEEHEIENNLKAKQTPVVQDTPNQTVNATAAVSIAPVLKASEQSFYGGFSFRRPYSRPPPRKRIETTVTKEILCTPINEGYKDISTLYLDHRDHLRISKCLGMFKNKKDAFELLGIPYKLGILLHGAPGTGKSSTILTVGSYLQKDLYHIDLTEVDTNDDLRLLFEYVNKNCSNGGVIIFEDIDAMTKVVHRRAYSTDQDKNAETVAALASAADSPLTLSYFLNVLQGSLTIAGTVFVVTTNDLMKLDPAFYRDGRIDVTINMGLTSHYQMKAMYARILERQIPEDLLLKMPDRKILPATFIQRLIEFKFEVDIDDAEVLRPYLEESKSVIEPIQ